MNYYERVRKELEEMAKLRVPGAARALRTLTPDKVVEYERGFARVSDAADCLIAVAS